jgi:hypothetical protein
MSDCIYYFANMTGVEFNNYLNPADRMPQSYFDERLPGHSDPREGRLRNHDEFVGLDLTGAWTEIVCWRMYVALLQGAAWSGAAEIRAEIQDWEHKLRELLPTTEIYRVAGFFVGEWRAANREPIHDPQDMRRFLAWLPTQEESGQYWRRLPDAEQAQRLNSP